MLTFLIAMGVFGGAPAITGTGSGSIGTIAGGGTGTLGPVPITGTGGGPIGTIGGGGSGEITDPPITDTGTIIATATRTVTPQAVPSATGASLVLPISAYAWAAPFDPSDRAPYAIDWTSLLGSGETIEQIDKITMTAAGVSLGLQVDTSTGRSPIISTDHKQTQLWFLCSPTFQQNAAFAGAGVQVGVSVLIRTDADPYKQFERTAVLTVRQQ